MLKDEGFRIGISRYSNENDGYPDFEQSIKARFTGITTNATVPLFTTNAEGLFDLFLDNLPQEARQHYTCNACQHFVNRFGGLVSISETGETTSVMWDESAVPAFFRRSVKAMEKAVLKAKVTGVFITSDKKLGTPKTGEWTHMAVMVSKRMIHTSRIQTAGQKMAEKREDFRILISSLLDYSVTTVEQALTILNSESLYRGDRFLGIAQWFKALHDKRTNTQNSRQAENLVWLAVATAPNGFCHVRSSMIGTLLDDIKDGYSFDSIKNRFEEKMNPANYMRAQSAPSENTIQQAEKMVEKLGIANSLRRRYATFEEIPFFIWRNRNMTTTEKPKSNGGVFGHLAPKAPEANPVALPTTVMTWEKFARTVLPTADSLEVSVDNKNRLMALVTASDETAPNLLQWDNPFSWYYHGGIDGEIRRRVESAGGRYANNEIRCSLIWEGYTDLDLHCITPRGEHIYYGTKRIGQGWLDTDANGGHADTTTPVENIRWADNAQSGRYKFYVHNFHERGKGTTPYKVELEVNGKVMSYNGVARGTGYQQDIFTFDYVKGQQLNIVNAQAYSSDDAWSVPVNGFMKVNGITNSPNLWSYQVPQAGNHIFFLLDGCKDSSEGKGRGFFVETLQSDLREIRKTLELYTASTPIEDVENASACGVGYSKDSEWNLVVRVTSNNSKRLVKIDRWD